MTSLAAHAELEHGIQQAAHHGVVPGSPHPGVDVVDVDQLSRQLDAAGDRLHRRLFTRAERTFCASDMDRLATTLAGKEAVAKALGTGLRSGVRWTDIEIVREPAGRPVVVLHGRANDRAAALGVNHIAISLCHEGPYAIAVASAVPEKATS